VMRTLANQRIAKAGKNLVLHKPRNMDLELNLEVVANMAAHVDDLPEVRTIIALFFLKQRTCRRR
jgi:hypothetical protein